ncbi:MAG: threonylcarbamoyl-AMP synthase [Nitrospinota bacterium]|nr:MAG: threonylcarbamoyl-AMP synthase [Nitrospinota bacterium]
MRACSRCRSWPSATNNWPNGWTSIKNDWPARWRKRGGDLRREVVQRNREHICKIDAPYALERAARLIRAGRVVAFPTDTLYGLGVDAWNPQALEQVSALKGRKQGRPFPVLIATPAQLSQLVAAIPPRVQRLIDAFWPGPLTLLFPPHPAVHPLLVGASGKIGVRLPAHPQVQELIRLAGVPITGTSANPSGAPPARNAREVATYFGRRVDLILDGGQTPATTGSTVVDATVDPPRFIREGVLSRSRILPYLEA